MVGRTAQGRLKTLANICAHQEDAQVLVVSISKMVRAYGTQTRQNPAKLPSLNATVVNEARL
jgi:hypothetical protein